MGKLSNHKRIKHHDMPGDIPKNDKIAFREGKPDSLGHCGKSFNDEVVKRTRVVNKRRTSKEITEQLDDESE